MKVSVDRIKILLELIEVYNEWPDVWRLPAGVKFDA
ncbi:hypothetical protein SOVF_195080 [Spinacia oleracea]|nr:hypothetical protein SOVF_195080 [Spinacia oleracea]